MEYIILFCKTISFNMLYGLVLLELKMKGKWKV